MCKRTVSCRKQGICDDKVHIGKNMHQDNKKGMKNQSTLCINHCCCTFNYWDCFFNIQHKFEFDFFLFAIFLFTSVEVKMAVAIVDNNIPFAAADTFSSLVKEMFPHSEIAKSHASARTKTTCTVSLTMLSNHNSGMCVFRVWKVY